MAAVARAPLVVIIEGGIGLGKSSIIRRLGKANGWAVVEEPIDDWKEELAEMYANVEEKAFNFQLTVRKSLLGRLPPLSHVTEPVMLVERSPWSSRYVFLANLRGEGLVSGRECGLLEELFEEDKAARPEAFRADLILLADASTETALERVRRRGRPGEEAVSAELLSRLQELHRRWLLDGQPVPPYAPVHLLNTEAPLRLVCEEAQSVIRAKLSDRPQPPR